MNYVRKNNGVSDADLLKLMDFLSVLDACALIAGCSPNQIRTQEYDGEICYYLETGKDDPLNANEVFSIVLKSILTAIEHGILKANIKVDISTTTVYKQTLQSDWIATHGICPKNTSIARDDLKTWLEQRGVYPLTLFPNGKKDDYMNPEHRHYAPKLALCVAAWEAAQTANPQGETYKQFIENWMRENAAAFGVENNTKAKIFEELASVSNWHTKGGRVSANLTPQLEPTIDLQEVKENLSAVHRKLEANLFNQPDDDIPF